MKKIFSSFAYFVIWFFLTLLLFLYNLCFHLANREKRQKEGGQQYENRQKVVWQKKKVAKNFSQQKILVT